MAQEQNRIVIDETQAKMLQPPGTAWHTPGEVGRPRKVHHRFKLPIEATQSKRVTVCVKPPGSRTYNLMTPLCQ